MPNVHSEHFCTHWDQGFSNRKGCLMKYRNKANEKAITLGDV